MSRPRPRRRAGLRATVTLAFAVGALLISAVLALGTYLAARHQLVDQRERTATRQAYADAALVRDSLLTSGAEVSDVLGSISPPPGAVILLRLDGRWYSSSLDAAGPDLTDEVRPVVADGSVALAWTDETDPPSVVVGVPLPAVGGEYYEVVEAEELDRTLSTLAIALWTSAVVTTVAGALVGRAAVRQVLRPLRRVAGAATRVADGDVTTRLDAGGDPDLEPLVVAFNEMVDAVQERIERDARFAADVSHELRTPVTTLTTSLSLLEGASDLSPRTASAVALMSDELARFRLALEDLLVIGRLDAGARERDPSPVGVADLVHQSLAAASVPAEGRLEGDAAALARTVRVDRPQVVRALANLVRNATIHAGGLRRVRVVGLPGVVELHVEDDGPGVPAEERERVFERFARAGGQKVGTGSGLGLSIVRQTVVNHGGQVWCEARAGGGADFVVRLPSVGDRS
ncbi:sensor histidine kinase [Nocardioides litoris]|uniref:sensor histidine kinase n=1 Tax=Nocardioides litoris TaxID=1926648 RepID=UPI00111E14C5|nr:HAMP domain-containing sensor histidine kinase [Nocardioides litoris]